MGKRKYKPLEFSRPVRKPISWRSIYRTRGENKNCFLMIGPNDVSIEITFNEFSVTIKHIIFDHQDKVRTISKSEFNMAKEKAILIMKGFYTNQFRKHENIPCILFNGTTDLRSGNHHPAYRHTSGSSFISKAGKEILLKEK